MDEGQRWLDSQHYCGHADWISRNGVSWCTVRYLVVERYRSIVEGSCAYINISISAQSEPEAGQAVRTSYTSSVWARGWSDGPNLLYQLSLSRRLVRRSEPLIPAQSEPEAGQTVRTYYTSSVWARGWSDRPNLLYQLSLVRPSEPLNHALNSQHTCIYVYAYLIASSS